MRRRCWVWSCDRTSTDNKFATLLSNVGGSVRSGRPRRLRRLPRDLFLATVVSIVSSSSSAVRGLPPGCSVPALSFFGFACPWPPLLDDALPEGFEAVSNPLALHDARGKETLMSSDI